MTKDANPDPLLGTVLEGRFRLERLLGEGGMGRVYIGEELRLQRRCAVKVLLPELSSDPAYVERFLREAQAIAALEHDNVVDIYHLGEDSSGLLFFAMEFLSGEDLETRIDHRGARPYTWVECCRWGIEVARGMAAVHHAGLVHRDLKPSNVFLARRDGHEVVKLLDFGIARAQGVGNLTVTGTALGTPNYMAPEQVLAQPLDGRADLYSLGVLLFEVLTGELPFHGEPIQVAMQHCHSPPPRPSQVAPEYEIPAGIEAVVLKAMAKDPAQRFPSMEALEAALASLLPDPTARRGITNPLRSVTPTKALTATGSLAEAEDDDNDDSPTLLRMFRRKRPTQSTQPNERPADARRGAHVALIIGLVAAAVGGLVALLFLLQADVPEPPPPGVVAPDTALPAPAAPPMGPPPEPSSAITKAVTSVAKGTPAHTSRSLKMEEARRKLHGKAQDCRRKHAAPTGPLITIDYDVRSAGSVSQARARQSGDLAVCLTNAVKSTRFPAGLALRQTIDL